jgi:hypothetical protein
MPRNAPEPSEFLAMMQHHWQDELKHLRAKAPLWRCFDCKRWIPRDELPMKCSECSGPPLQGKKVGYKYKKILQDAMVCKNCVNKHDHLRKMVLDAMIAAYAHGLEKRLTMEAMKGFAAQQGIN